MSTQSPVLIEAHFLPSIEYFCSILPHSNVILEKHENFNKQSYRNRCYILTANGIERLSLPLTAKSGKVKITDVRIDYTTRWRENFWRTMTSAYANSPYFEHYGDELRAEIFSNVEFLYDMNRNLLSLCLQWLKIPKTVSDTVSYVREPEGVRDLRDIISAKKDFESRKFYSAQPYQQVFGSKFVPNLSVADLVFCTGPDAGKYVRTSLYEN